MINSGALQSTTQVLGVLNNLHAAAQGLAKAGNYMTNLETAENAGDMVGGLALVGNTAGSTSDLLAAASTGLAIVATLVAPEAAGAILIASAGLNGLSNTLNAIQNAVGEFNTLIDAIDNAINQAQNDPDGEPVVIDPPSGGGTDAHGDPIKPTVITSDDGRKTIQIEESQHQSLTESDFAPPDGGLGARRRSAMCRRLRNRSAAGGLLMAALPSFPAWIDPRKADPFERGMSDRAELFQLFDFYLKRCFNCLISI